MADLEPEPAETGPAGTEALSAEALAKPKTVIPDAEPDSSMPKLSITEIMFVTASMAIVFAFQEKLARSNMMMDSEVAWFSTVSRLATSVFMGLPLAATYRLTLQTRTAGFGSFQPGHWILLAALVNVLSFSIPFLIFSLVWGEDDSVLWFDNWFQNLYFGSIGFFALFSTIILASAAFRYAGIWKLLLLMMAIGNTLVAMQMFAICYMYRVLTTGNGVAEVIYGAIAWIDSILNVLLVVLLLVACVKELRSAADVVPARDRWHWAGLLVLFVSTGVMPLLNFVYITWLFDASEVP